MKLSLLWAAAQPFPKSVAEYAARVAVDSPEFLAPYRAMKGRLRELETAGPVLAARLGNRQEGVKAAIRQLQQTFSEKDYDALIAAARYSAALESVIAIDPSLPAFLVISDRGAWTVVCREFPGWRKDLASMIETMLWRVGSEIARVEPLELAAMREEAQRRAAEYGEKSTEQPGAEKSPLLCRLTQFKDGLTRCLAQLKGHPVSGIARSLGELDLFLAVANQLDPALEHFQG